MSSFAVLIKRVWAIKPHPNADMLEFAITSGYRSLVKKNTVSVGDLVAYIPEYAILPKTVLKHLGLWDEQKNCGKLCGKNGDRVRTIKLRGEVSQGICYPVNRSGDNNFIVVNHPDGEVSNIPVTEGDDVTAILGITKYEPPIPISLSGEVFNAGREYTLDFDVENWKSYPDLLIDGEEVIFTEKLHGTCTMLTFLPYLHSNPEAFGDKKNILICSKGLGSRGLAFKNNEQNVNNLYVRSTANLVSKINELQSVDLQGPPNPIFILGETVGPGVQDLPYCDEICFNVFSVVHGYRSEHNYVDWYDIYNNLRPFFGFECVPILYQGPFSKEIMLEHTDGKTALEADHIREGIVITPVIERHHPKLGRVCLKSVSDAYLTRKNGTEYN